MKFLLRIKSVLQSPKIFIIFPEALYIVRGENLTSIPRRRLQTRSEAEHTKRPSKSRFYEPRFTHQSSNDGNEFKAFPSRVHATRLGSDSRERMENEDGKTVKESRRQPGARGG